MSVSNDDFGFETLNELDMNDAELEQLRSDIIERKNAIEALGIYKIHKLCGVGGMGIVFKAEDNVQRSVAIKTPRKDIGRTKLKELAERFQREGMIGGTLGSHTNLVSIYAYDNDVPYIAMEFVEGKHLRAVLLERKATGQMRYGLNKIIKIMCDLLNALSYAHECDIIHRDIKPENIMIRNDGVLKLMDFSIARGNKFPALTKFGQSLGTRKYASPELLRVVDDEINELTDIFSSGMILYELLTGQQAFGPIDNEGIGAYVIRMYKQELTNPSQLDEEIHECFDFIVRKALALRQGDRFKTAEEFSKVLLEARDFPDKCLLRLRSNMQKRDVQKRDIEFQAPTQKRETKPVVQETKPANEPYSSDESIQPVNQKKVRAINVVIISFLILLFLIYKWLS